MSARKPCNGDWDERGGVSIRLVMDRTDFILNSWISEYEASYKHFRSNLDCTNSNLKISLTKKSQSSFQLQTFPLIP